MTETATQTLGSVCELIVDSEHKTAPTQSYGNPLIRTPNIGRGRFVLDNVKRISHETYKAWTRRASPRTNDLIMAREAPVGNIAIVPANLDPVLGQRTVLIRPDERKVDPNYLVYLLLGDEVQGNIQSFSTGATVAHLNMADIRNLRLPTLPSLSIQHKIASVLSNYDDLIENNTRRIEVLEEVAQRIYREWFVNFRFPGYEKVGIVESPLGTIPRGWEVKAFSEIAAFINGYAFKPRHWGDTGKPIIKIAELKNGITDKTPRYQGSDIGQKYHIQNGDVLFSWSADLNVYVWSRGKAFLNQHLFNVLPHSGYSRVFLFYSLKDRMQEFRSRSQGTTMRHIKRSALDEVKVAVAPEDIRTTFDQHAEPILSQVEVLQTKNENLRRTRDMLLPKLISGEVTPR